MLSAARLLVICGLLLAGCGPARDVAVSTFRVLDTPHRLIRERIDPPETTTTTTVETTETSDVGTPGRPVTIPRDPSQRIGSQSRPSGPAASPRSSRTSPPVAQAKPSATPRASSTLTTQFPTAKPVPGRPGYVYSIDPKGGIVDVTGYKSGDRAKDPYTQQVFVVP